MKLVEEIGKSPLVRESYEENNSNTTLEDKLSSIKHDFEGAIKNPKDNPTHSLIRTQKLINRIHDYVEYRLTEEGISEDKIHRDKILYGYPKSKSQDTVVYKDYDNRIVGPELSVNIRSQLSSIGRNIDTIQERIMNESSNIHNRFPRLPLGYLYFLPMYGYDTQAKSDNKVKRNENYDIEKCLDIFASIAGRKNPSGDKMKYNAFYLLLVDFSESPPEIIDDIGALVEEGLVSPDFAKVYRSSRDYDILDKERFFDKLMNDYRKNYSKLMY